MKYYIGHILERNGEFDYTDRYLFITEGDPHKFTDRAAAEWRPNTNWDSAHEGWWCDHTLIFNHGYTEVTESDFRILNKYLPAIAGFQGESE